LKGELRGKVKKALLALKLKPIVINDPPSRHALYLINTHLTELPISGHVIPNLKLASFLLSSGVTRRRSIMGQGYGSLDRLGLFRGLELLPPDFKVPLDPKASRDLWFRLGSYSFLLFLPKPLLLLLHLL
jgi:hypothetical protein